MFKRVQILIHFLIISSFFLCCTKGPQEQVEPPDPFIRDTLSGLYRFGNFWWESTDANGSSINGDMDGKVQVDYKGGKTVEITLLSSKYPYKKNFTATLRDSSANGVTYYRYYHTFEHTTTHWSEIRVHFDVFDNLNIFPPNLTEFFFCDFTMSNSTVVSPSYSVHCGNFSKQ